MLEMAHLLDLKVNTVDWYQIVQHYDLLCSAIIFIGLIFVVTKIFAGGGDARNVLPMNILRARITICAICALSMLMCVCVAMAIRLLHSH